MESVLVFSKWTDSASVAHIIDRLRDRGLHSVLITSSADQNCEICDDHILLDWGNTDLPALFILLEQRGIHPVAIVNPVEQLNGWQVDLADHYGLPGADSFRKLLANKFLLRTHMKEMSLSAIRFCDAPAAVDFFPAIVKPSLESSASWLVRRVDSSTELRAYQRCLVELGHEDIELVIEEYLHGTEFSLDGPAVGGSFYPIFAVEKPDYSYAKHHNAGLEIYPPQQDHVRASVRSLREMIDALCADLHLDQIWLHIEARASEDGRAEVVEINPRPGGGMLTVAIRQASGIDQIDAFISMALNQFTIPQNLPSPLHNRQLIGMADVEASELGIVEIETSEKDLFTLPGVIGADVMNGLRISSLEKENFFLRFALTGASVGQLRSRYADVIDALDFHVVAPPAPPRFTLDYSLGNS